MKIQYVLGRKTRKRKLSILYANQQYNSIQSDNCLIQRLNLRRDPFHFRYWIGSGTARWNVDGQAYL